MKWLELISDRNKLSISRLIPLLGALCIFGLLWRYSFTHRGDLPEPTLWIAMGGLFTALCIKYGINKATEVIGNGK